MKKLYELGHRKIDLVVGGSHRASATSRSNTCIQFHKDKGLQYDESFIARCEIAVPNSESINLAQKPVKELLT